MSSQPLGTPLQQAILRSDVPLQARVLLAVSGGADSTALFDAVLGVVRSGQRIWHLMVGHVNHSLRGEESDQDEEFVRSMAELEGVPFRSARVDAGAHARAHRLSLEAAARELRYQALFELLDQWDGDFLMTGHTEDDQAETVLLRLLRGSGLRGLGGMRGRNGRLVRPLLGIRREKIITSLQESGRGYQLDASNADTRHTRNRIRRDVIPALELVQPQLVPVLARTAALLQMDADFLFEQARDALRLMDVHSGDGLVSASRSVWRALHPAVAHAALMLLVEQALGGATDIGQEHMSALAEAIERQTRMADQLPHGLVVSAEGNRFEVRGRRPETSCALNEVLAHVPGVSKSEAGVLHAVLVQRDRETVRRWLSVCGPWHAICDADRLDGQLSIGSRLPGERMIPLGSPGSRKLQDIFVDRTVPRARRARVAVIRDAAKIVWIPGIALDSRVAVTSATSRMVHLRWEPGAKDHRDRMRG